MDLALARLLVGGETLEEAIRGDAIGGRQWAVLFDQPKMDAASLALILSFDSDR